jgi:serine phosphatase RsbU (regulator of sigma subunit)
VRRRLATISVAVVTAMMALTVVGALVTRSAVHNQQSRLLRERTNEIGLVFTSAISALPGPLDVLGGVLRATNNSPSAFAQASAAAEVGSKGTVTFALIQKTSTGFTVVMVKGNGLHVGQVITDQRVQAFRRAMTLTTKQVVPTAVIGTGSARALGFALGAPVAPAGMVLYRQVSLGQVGPPREAATAPFSELNVVLYASATPQPSEVLAETGTTLKGPVRTQPLPAGAGTWTLQAAAVHPLVGAATAAAAWIVLVSGLGLSLLVGSVVEVESRRRNSALALYESEHRVAETLQRSLLPLLPDFDDLDLSARYLPGAREQEVGGDWFDVFTIEDGRVGIVIGDVVGHDIAAAAAMSQIQASLRACAWKGAAPNAVLNHLDALISSFTISDLVTVFYGLLDAPDDTGGRTLTYANAGHLPPLVRDSDGEVSELDDAGSVLLGAPTWPDASRALATITLTAGSTLLMFTDGLVEAPGESLTDALANLKSVVRQAPPQISAEALCDLVLADVDPQRLRDDIAVLTMQLPPRSPSGQQASAHDAVAN